MHYKTSSFIDRDGDPSCQFDFQIGKRKEFYILSYEDTEARDRNIDRTKYDWLQQNLERVVNNIRYLAANVHPEHYRQFAKQLEIVQEIKMRYKISTRSKVLIKEISNRSEAFYKLCPPRDSKFYQSIKSQITALVLYCEMN